MLIGDKSGTTLLNSSFSPILFLVTMTEVKMGRLDISDSSFPLMRVTRVPSQIILIIAGKQSKHISSAFLVLECTSGQLAVFYCIALNVMVNVKKKMLKK